MRDLTFVTVGDGPEDVIFDDRGRVLTGLRNEGRIVRVDPDSGAVEEIAQVGGMPLGLDWLPDGRLPEIVEWKDHPWFIGVQFHPELKSKPFAPHPLFDGFVKAAVEVSRLV